MRGVLKVLQLLYKKEPQTFKHSVIFQHSLLQQQCSSATFLLSCLFLEERIFSLVFKITFQQQLQAIRRLQSGFQEDNILDF